MTEQTSTKQAQESALKSDIIGGAIAAIVFAVALIMTIGWPDKAAMFPRIVTGSGLALALIFETGILLKWRRSKVPGYVERPHQSVEERVEHHAHQEDAASSGENDEHEQVEDVEYVFATAGRAAWAQVLGWVAVFLVLLTLFGLFIGSGIFAFVYLRWGGKRTWLFSAIYALVLPLILVSLFRWLLFIATPTGILTGL